MKPAGLHMLQPTEKKRKEVPQMQKKNEKKDTFKKPILLRQEKYATASSYHCHQVKEECSPYQAKA